MPASITIHIRSLHRFEGEFLLLPAQPLMRFNRGVQSFRAIIDLCTFTQFPTATYNNKVGHQVSLYLVNTCT